MRPESEPSGQKRSFIEEARRRQIIDAAVAVLAEVGYGNASLARIASRAGISKGVISYHFAGKDELMHEVAIQLYVLGGEHMTPPIEAADTCHAKLMAYIDANIRFIAEHRGHVVAASEVMLNARDADGRPTFFTEEGSDSVAAPLVELLRAGQETGEFGDLDPDAVARMLRDVIDGVGNRVLLNPDFDAESYAAQVRAVFDRAVRAPTGGEKP